MTAKIFLCLFTFIALSTLVQGDSEENVKDWTSLEDCLTNYPKVPYKLPPPPPAHARRVYFYHEFPHAAAIGWSNPKSDTIDWKCGGSLISEDTILTAAHCLRGNFGRPDVVRLGDLNLKTDTDEKGAQQFVNFTKDQFIYHPSYTKKFNDIALIKLKTKVEVTKFVIPACLWTKHDLPQEVNLEACGFGQTKYRGKYSPSLLKVSLSAISTEECDDHYYGSETALNNGLSENAHLCAHDKSGIGMETCRGDSGGPLEMKLHYGKKLVPFVVGVTSFGEDCGARKPGVYARVSSYIEWIKEHVPDLEVNAVECSKKYEELRYIDWTPYQVQFQPQKLVYGDQLGQHALATIISDQFLIAAASNLKKISNPQTVLFQRNGDIFIEKIFYHPNYVQNNLENDLAVIKLKSRIRWDQEDHPVCVIQKDINVDYSDASNKGSLSQDEKLIGWKDLFREKLMNSEITNCLASNETSADLNTLHLICFKTESSYHVPDSCTVPVGSAIPYNPYGGSHKTVIKGLAIQSHDCTFTLAIDISKHYEWINSVVFGSDTN